MDTETITVTLPAETVRDIRRKVESGAFASADEVVEEALRLLDDEVIEKALPPIDETVLETPEFIAYMREKIRKSLDDPRPSIPLEEVFERLRRRHEERLKAPRDEV